MTDKMHSSSISFSFLWLWLLNLSLSLSWSLTGLSLPLCSLELRILSRFRSPHAALSPFQSQYFVVIAADCFQGGDHINTETCGYYVTLLSFHHSPFQPLPSSCHFPCFFIHSSIHGDIPMSLFLSLSPLPFPQSSLPSICSVWICLYLVFHPLRLSLSLQRQAMNI